MEFGNSVHRSARGLVGARKNHGSGVAFCAAGRRVVLTGEKSLRALDSSLLPQANTHHTHDPYQLLLLASATCVDHKRISLSELLAIVALSSRVLSLFTQFEYWEESEEPAPAKVVPPSECLK